MRLRHLLEHDLELVVPVSHRAAAICPCRPDRVRRARLLVDDPHFAQLAPTHLQEREGEPEPRRRDKCLPVAGQRPGHSVRPAAKRDFQASVRRGRRCAGTLRRNGFGKSRADAKRGKQCRDDSFHVRIIPKGPPPSQQPGIIPYAPHRTQPTRKCGTLDVNDDCGIQEQRQDTNIRYSVVVCP